MDTEHEVFGEDGKEAAAAGGLGLGGAVAACTPVDVDAGVAATHVDAHGPTSPPDGLLGGDSGEIGGGSTLPASGGEGGRGAGASSGCESGMAAGDDEPPRSVGADGVSVVDAPAGGSGGGDAPHDGDHGGDPADCTGGEAATGGSVEADDAAAVVPSVSDHPAWPMANATEAERLSALNRVMVAFFLHVMAWAVTLPVLSALLDDMAGGDTTKAATWLSLLQVCTGCVELVMNLILGALTDRYGRHTFFMTSLALTGVGWLLFGVMPTIGLLFVAALFRGFTSVGTVVGYAMIVDLSKSAEEDETAVSKNMGRFLAMGSIGLLTGPIIGGVLGVFSNEAGFIVAGILNLASAVYVYYFVPETLRESKDFSWSQLLPHHTLGILVSQTALIELVLVFFIANMSFGPYQLGALYTDMRFGWEALEVGLFLGYAGIVAMFSQAVLTKYSLKAWGEVKSLFVGLVCGVLHFFLLGLAPEAWMWLIAVPATSMVFVSFPAVRGLMAKQVPPHKQGRLQGAIGSMNTITTMLAPLWSAAVFAASEDWAEGDWPPGAGELHFHSGVMWYSSAACILLAVFVAMFIRRRGPSLVKPHFPDDDQVTSTSVHTEVELPVKADSAGEQLAAASAGAGADAGSGAGAGAGVGREAVDGVVLEVVSVGSSA